MTEEEEFEFRHRFEMEQAAAPAAPQQVPRGPEQAGYSAKDALAPWDAGLSMLTGMAAAPVAGLAGATRGLLPGPQGSAAETVHSVQDALTYQPRTRLGGEMAGLAGKVLEVPARIGNAAGEATTDASGSPALGTAVNVAVQSIPALLMRGGQAAQAAARVRALRNEAPVAVTNDTLRLAVDNDYRMPPSMMGRNTGTLETLAGREELMRQAQTHNAQVVNNANRADTGIPGVGQINQAQIEGLAIPQHTAAYGRVSLLSQNAAAVVDGIRQLGAEIRVLRRQDARNPTPDTTAALQQAERQMGTYHQMLEHEATARGQPALAADLREARVALGRIGSVERALNEGTGNVSAKDLARQREQGVPIDNNPGMATAARVSTLDNGVLVKEPSLRPKGEAGLVRSGWEMTQLPRILRAALLSRPVQNLARPRDIPPAPPPLSAMTQAQRAAIIAALQQQE